MEDQDVEAVLTGHTNDVNSCDFAVDGTLVTSSSDKTVRVWARSSPDQPPTEVSYSPLTYHTYSVHCVRFSPRGTSFLSCSTDGTAVLWNAKTGVSEATLRHPSQSPLRTCAFSPDGSLLATAGDDGDVCVWSTDQPAVLLWLRGHEETVSCLAFSGDGALLASGALQGELRVWRPRAGITSSIAIDAAAHDLGVTGCHFKPCPAADDGSAILASCGNDCAVRLWTVLTSGGMSALTVLTAHTGAVMAVKFSPDGALLASAAGDKTVRLWDTTSWKLLSNLHGHSRYVTCCAFSPDGRLLVSGSNDKTVRLQSLPAADGAAPVTPLARVRSDSRPNRQPPLWSCQEVGEWLRSLGLAQYAGKFADSSIDGAALLKLTERQLSDDLAIELVGHRNKLVRQLERLRREPERVAGDPPPPPDEFYCPITRELMREPVVCSDGYSYEQAAIAAWLQERNSSPMTNEPLADTTQIPNLALRSLIAQWRAQPWQ